MKTTVTKKLKVLVFKITIHSNREPYVQTTTRQYISDSQNNGSILLYMAGKETSPPWALGL